MNSTEVPVIDCAGWMLKADAISVLPTALGVKAPAVRSALRTMRNCAPRNPPTMPPDTRNAFVAIASLSLLMPSPGKSGRLPLDEYRHSFQLLVGSLVVETAIQIAPVLVLVLSPMSVKNQRPLGASYRIRGSD